jgi:hypothetical protein
MSSNSPSSTTFSPSQAFHSPYKYEDPTEHQIPQSYSDLSPSHERTKHNPHRQPDKIELTPSDTKVRLRKACDSCSVRKVKVYKSRICKAGNNHSISVMKAAHHANPAQPSTFPVPSKDLVGGEDPQTSMLKLSRDKRCTRIAHTLCQRALQLMMPPIVLRRCPCRSLFLQNQYATWKR